ncbi:MAG: hypothetical protein Q7K39_01835 [Candidatus Magasanikbacteria bacterium]|nr:hypothetical protein [Candidatus Magasanikbacteria bacterium]
MTTVPQVKERMAWTILELGAMAVGATGQISPLPTELAHLEHLVPKMAKVLLAAIAAYTRERGLGSGEHIKAVILTRLANGLVRVSAATPETDQGLMLARILCRHLGEKILPSDALALATLVAAEVADRQDRQDEAMAESARAFENLLAQHA